MNDLAFGYHAVLLTVVTIIQAAVYKTQRQRVHPIHAFIVITLWVLTAYTLILCFLSSVPLLPKCTTETDDDGTTHSVLEASFTLIDMMGFVKVFISIIKYTPQAYLNYRRQSTVGWSITNILLDFTGGSLSFAQQCVESINAGNTTPLFGNIPKLLLALESVAFDVVFMAQHYCLYRGKGVKQGEGGEEPLVDGEEEEGEGDTEEGEGKPRGGRREGDPPYDQVEGAISPVSRSSKAQRPPAQGRRNKQQRPLRVLEDVEGGGGEGADAVGVGGDGYLHYRPPEVVDEDVDDPYEPGFHSNAAVGRVNSGSAMPPFRGGGGSPSRSSRAVGGGGGVSGGGSPRLTIVDRYGDSGVPSGRR